jgi:hypothetical protein
MAGILQGIMKRYVDGTASSAGEKVWRIGKTYGGAWLELRTETSIIVFIVLIA